MPDEPTDAESNPYRMTLAELEAVHVPYEALVTEQPTSPARDARTEWDEEHRQARLAGGA